MIELSPLAKTWLVDIDGTIFRHNGHLFSKDELLPGTADFINSIPPTDRIVLLTSRSTDYEAVTKEALRVAGIRYDHILFGLPTGERIVINDAKPSGLQMAYAINLERDKGLLPFSDMVQIVDK